MRLLVMYLIEKSWLGESTYFKFSLFINWLLTSIFKLHCILQFHQITVILITFNYLDLQVMSTHITTDQGFFLCIYISWVLKLFNYSILLTLKQSLQLKIQIPTLFTKAKLKMMRHFIISEDLYFMCVFVNYYIHK